MKKHLSNLAATLLLLLMVPDEIKAQDYIPFSFEKGRWFVEVFEKGGYQEWIQIYCKGDTVINNQEYYKLFQNKLILEPQGDLIPDTLIGLYLGAIRNAENKQVIFKSLFEDTPTVIYDFNLSIGDTIKGFLENFIIDDIDSVEYCGIYRKRYIQELRTPLEEILIEGIGYSNGLLGYFYPFKNGESTRVLKCYTEVENYECPTCENLLSTATYETETIIYPIPAESSIAIKSSTPISQMRIISISGTEAISSNYNNQLFIQECIEDISPGVYLIEIVFFDSTKKTSVIIKN